MKVKLKGITWFWEIFLIFALGLGIFFFLEKAKALEWYESLITDGDFINTDSMTLQQIQDFLVSKGSYLANYRTTWGPADRTAAEWIYEEGREHGINPQVILVTLQKEQSLITSSSASQRALDWATGYGAYSGCDPNTGGWCEQYKGFGAQIHYAASMMRGNFDLGRGPGSCLAGQYCLIQTRSWEPGYTNVLLSNRATAVLYRYTPYIYNGNYNFYILSQNWFPCSFYLALGNDQRAFLVDQDVKKHIVDLYVFSAWGFGWNQMTSNNVEGIPEGHHISYLAKDSSSRVYFMDQGQKKHILDPNIFSAWGFSWSDVAPVSDCLLNSRGSGHYISYTVKGSGPNVYFMKDGKKMHIQSLETFNNLRFNWSDVVTIRDEFLWNIPFGHPINRLVKGSSPAVYLLENGKKRHITSLGAFRRMGFRWEDVAELPDPFIWGIPEGKKIY